ncbi:POT family-domain-containing protein [Mycena floridula]|nr:POT family-domain-containing protein [Mycena floridula]
MAGNIEAPIAALAEEAHIEEKKQHQRDSDDNLVDKNLIHQELDGIHDGLEFPTAEELVNLRRVSDRIPWNAYLIAGIETAERFSYYGSTVVFTNFIQQPLPPGSHTGAGFAHGQSGALHMGQRASTGLTTFFQFWSYLTPLLGAYLADAHFGRFKTISYALAITIIGHIILIISAVPGVIDKTNSAKGVFALSLVIMGLGTGMFKSNVSPLIAEQYTKTKLFITTRKNGERVIVDPAITVGRIYMYFYLFVNVGALIGQLTMTYTEKYVGFYAAYLLPTVIYLFCPLLLYVGRNRYIRSPPTGSVLATCVRLFRYAARGKWSINPVRTWKNFNTDTFWDDAKPSRYQGTKPAWMIYDDAWVNEVERGLKACAVFLWYPIYWLTYNQINNNLISQAATMSLHGVPNDVLSNIDPLALLILIPLFDQLLYPALRRWKIKWTSLKKITTAFFAGCIAMIWAAVLQHYIYKATFILLRFQCTLISSQTNPCGYQASTCKDANDEPLVSPLNVWIQTGSYVFVAVSEILASIVGLEYAFTKAPKNMKSLVTSVFLFTSAVSAALGEAFVSLSTDPLLVWNYGSMGVLAFIGGILFWLSVRNLDAKDDYYNNLSEGHVARSTKEIEDIQQQEKVDEKGDA